MRALPLMFLVAACVPAPAPIDSGLADVGPPTDTGVDTGTAPDQGVDAGILDADSGAEDMGFDAGPPDTGPPDTGPTHCPQSPAPACSMAAECGTDDIAPPLNCEYCVPANLSLCADATCDSPPSLDAADIHAIVVNVSPAIPDLESLGAFALAARTAGDQMITCADVYAGRVDLADRCYNVLDARSIGIGQTGNTYTVSLSGFASGQRTLFLVYGFTQVSARGDPVGLSCTAFDVGPPGSSEFIAGDDMIPL